MHLGHVLMDKLPLTYTTRGLSPVIGAGIAKRDILAQHRAIGRLFGQEAEEQFVQVSSTSDQFLQHNRLWPSPVHTDQMSMTTTLCHRARPWPPSGRDDTP